MSKVNKVKFYIFILERKKKVYIKRKELKLLGYKLAISASNS